MAGDVFVALAHPVRRRVLEKLAERPMTAGELAELFTLSRPAVAEHIQVLRDASLVHDERVGRHRVYHLETAPLKEVGEWMYTFDKYWRDRLRALATLFDDQEDNL